jgi:hypothetical protein
MDKWTGAKMRCPKCNKYMPDRCICNGPSAEERRAAPAAAQLDADLPPLPEPFDHVDMADDSVAAVFSADQYCQGQREAVAQYAERIRLLEHEAAEIRVAHDQAWAICNAVAEALGDDLDREAGSAESVRRLRHAQRPAQSIDTPEFREVLSNALIPTGASMSTEGLGMVIAYIDGRTASTAAPDGWQLVPVEPTMAMIAALGYEGDEMLAIGHGLISQGIANQYKAALAAAPSPLSGTEEAHG